VLHSLNVWCVISCNEVTEHYLFQKHRVKKANYMAIFQLFAFPQVAHI